MTPTEPMSDKQFEYYQNLLRHKAFSMIEYRLFREVERLRGIVSKLWDGWEYANKYKMPVADGSPSYRAAKRVLDCFKKAALSDKPSVHP